MAAPYHNLRSKLNRALVAWLIDQGCGGAGDVLPAYSVTDREFPITTVKAAIGTPEVALSGNYRIRVLITVKGRAAQTHTTGKPWLARQLFDARVAATYDALMQTDDQTSLSYTAKAVTSAGRGLLNTTEHPDMDDFTVLAWYEAGFGEAEAEDDGCDWRETLLFDAVCCASNIAGYSLTD